VCNQYLFYLFYLFQAANIFLVSIGQTMERNDLSWTGVGCGLLSTICYQYGMVHNKMIQKLYRDLQNIKNGDYIDEGAVVDPGDQKGIGSDNSAKIKLLAEDLQRQIETIQGLKNNLSNAGLNDQNRNNLTHEIKIDPLEY